MILLFATALLIAGGLSACSRNVSAFDQELRTAESSRQSGDYTIERLHFEQAMSLSRTNEEKSEALYRKARSYLRSGNVDEGLAILAELTSAYKNTSRAPRAWLDLGRIFQRTGEKRKAETCYQQLVAAYPSYGGAPEAARQIVELRQARGIAAHATYELLRKQNKEPELDEALRYYEAVEFVAQDSTRAASAFETLARLFPLPRGRYADEALLWAALLRRQADQPAQALALLHVLKKQDKQAWSIGSYTRTAYLDAYILSGQILRDDLNSPQKARLEFERLLKRHVGKSTDDALFELLLLNQHEGKDTCTAFRRLKQTSPNSKYLSCAALLCPVQLSSNRSELSETSVNRCQQWMAQGTDLRTRLRSN